MNFTEEELELIIDALETQAARLDFHFGRLYAKEIQIISDLIYKFKQQGG